MSELDTSANKDLVERAMRIIAREVSAGDVSVIRLDSTFEELGLDSFGAVNITFELEEEFGVDIPGEVLRDLKTVSDVVAKLRVACGLDQAAE